MNVQARVKGEVLCFHCQTPVAEVLIERYAVELLGERRAFCCAACRLVAESIAEAGLGRYYHHREGPPAQAPGQGLEVSEPDQPPAEVLYAGFISQVAGLASIDLAVEGLHCAACVWLVEQRLHSLPGIEQAQVGLEARRLHLAWRPEALALGDALEQLRRIGYRARPWQADEAAQAQAHETKRALKRLGVAGLLWFQTMMATMATWPEFNLGLTPELHQILRWAALFLTTPVVFYSCAPIFQGASRALRARQISLDVSAALAIGGAYLAGLYTTLTGQGELYFDAVSMFAFFLLTGRYLQARVCQRAAQASADWEARLPTTCLKLQANGQATPVLLSALAIGDQVLIPPGNRVPADGVVVKGQSRLDEALLTGEFKPRPCGPGALIGAGTLNLDQRLQMQVHALGGHTSLSAITRLLRGAQQHKPAAAQLADRMAKALLLISLVAALVAGAIWWWLAPAKAPWVVLALLVSACPCALALATPMALTAALTYLQGQGLLIARGHVLEALPHIDTLLLDKTGTLTEGRPHLACIRPLGALGADHCLTLASALQHGSGHPLSHAFAPVSVLAEQVHARLGLGVEGVVDGQRLRVGNPTWACELANAPAPAEPNDQQQWVLLANAQGPLAWFGLDDRLRESAALMLAHARQVGWQVIVASGDRSPAVRRLGLALGVETHAGLLPGQKLQLLERLQAQGRQVLAVGDGSNDAPLLAQAHIGIAMGRGTDLARTQADGVLLNNSLATLPEALKMSLRCRRVIRQNLTWAVLYNGMMLPLAACGLVTPAWAALGMSFSSLLVVLNALRLMPAKRARV
jgi:Cu2+-exporting ATPase